LKKLKIIFSHSKWGALVTALIFHRYSGLKTKKN
jgi:hypothetical protein